MARFQVHFSTSSVTGVLLGITSVYWLDFDWGAAISVAVYCAIGGTIPDLDSDSGIPAREMFNLVSVFCPLLLYHRLEQEGLSNEQVFACMVGIYLIIRFGLKRLFRKFTVHRGMFHSVPLMLITGLLVYLPGSATGGVEPTDSGVNQDMRHFHRAVLGLAAAIGVLTHLVLDEIWAVNWEGVTFHLNQFAGSAVKFWSSSLVASCLTYTILGGLIYATYLDGKRFNIHPQNWLAQFAPKVAPYVDDIRHRAEANIPGMGQPAAATATAATPPVDSPSTQPKQTGAPGLPASRSSQPAIAAPTAPKPATPPVATPPAGAPAGFPSFFRPPGN